MRCCLEMVDGFAYPGLVVFDPCLWIGKLKEVSSS